jgi:hypothetical protein
MKKELLEIRESVATLSQRLRIERQGLRRVRLHVLYLPRDSRRNGLGNQGLIEGISQYTAQQVNGEGMRCAMGRADGPKRAFEKYAQLLDSMAELQTRHLKLATAKSRNLM